MSIKGILNLNIYMLIVWGVVGCSPQSTTTINADQVQIDRIDSLFKDWFDRNLFHGGIVITNRGETIYENYLGVADRTWNIPMSKDVKFDIASLNKSMIAALVLKAVEEDKLHLDDKLVNLIQGFSYSGSFHPEITLHHMLCHSSGLSDYDGVDARLKQDNYREFKRLHFSNDEYVDFISNIAPVSEPGKQFHYSNFAYHLLSIILEETYGKTFSDILHDELAMPLGLLQTVSESSNEKVIDNLAKAYNFHEETGEWYQNQYIDLSLGRRIFSTTQDLNRWGQMKDNPGLLSKESLRLMKSNHLFDITRKVSYGYGWVVVDSVNKSVMGDLQIDLPYIIHGGSTDGYKSMLINVNGGELVISFLSNVGAQTNELLLARKIVNLIIEK
ncbi:serine hydrolase [bacterium]|nr:serine hydrolase [bacterium]